MRALLFLLSLFSDLRARVILGRRDYGLYQLGQRLRALREQRHREDLDTVLRRRRNG